MAKKAAKGAGSIRKRPDGTWEARCTMGYDPGTGAQIRKSFYGKTQKEVRQKLTQALAAMDDGAYFEPAKITVGKWLDTWVKEYTVDVKPLTVAAYKAQIDTNIKPNIGAVKLDALTAPVIQKMYNDLLAGGGRLPKQIRSTGSRTTRKPLAPKTIKNIHGILHRALNQAVEIGYIRFNPADACKLPKVQKKEIKPLEQEDVMKFLTAIHGSQYENIYMVDLFTGMRQGEILALPWSNINFETGEIRITRQLQKQKKQGGKYYFAPLKNDKTRSIIVAPTVLQALKRERSRQAAARLYAGDIWDVTGEVYEDSHCAKLVEDSDLVFTNELGRYLVAGTVYSHFKEIAKNIGRPDARFHDLRHSYAVAALQSGDDIKTLQGNLGHATASFTLDVYGHVSDQMKKASADRMEQYIKSVSSS